VACLWAGLESYVDRELCQLITMSSMGYIRICRDSKSVVYNKLCAKSRRLRVKYTIFYCTLWTLGSIVSSAKYIHKH
jgi:hypothetical protein